VSRSGYDDYDCEFLEWAVIRWRGAVLAETRPWVEGRKPVMVRAAA
jgi:hypothetical protein